MEKAAQPAATKNRKEDSTPAAESGTGVLEQEVPGAGDPTAETVSEAKEPKPVADTREREEHENKDLAKDVSDVNALDKDVDGVSATSVQPPADAAPNKVHASSRTPGKRPDVLDRMTPEEREHELRSQVTGLNAKLVSTFNRIADLEDELSLAHNRILVHTTALAELNKERDQYMYALNTGLLVEKAHVTTEMQRMMERVVDETAQRGKAESDRTRVEAELEELSASLFNEANKMVAVERLARAQAEAKSQDLERSLRDTERMMREQQEMLKNLQAQVEARGGTAVVPVPDAGPAPEPAHPAIQTLTVNIPPYYEFLAFLSHLRALHQQLVPYVNMHLSGIDWTQAMPSSMIGVMSPAMGSNGSSTRQRDYPYLPMSAENLVQLSSQMSLPFIRRAQDEDIEPCLRLSHASGLNWLTRRQATTALLDGNVVIEPLFLGGVVPDEEALRAEYSAVPPGACALCGTPLLNVGATVPAPSEASRRPHDLLSTASSLAQTRRSLPSIFHSLRRSASELGRSSDASEEKESNEIFSQETAAESAATLPIPTHCFRITDSATSRYLVCTHHCLHRLRAVYGFWTFIRTLERAIVLEGKFEPEFVGQTRIGRAERPMMPATKFSSEPVAEREGVTKNDVDAAAERKSAELTLKDEEPNIGSKGDSSGTADDKPTEKALDDKPQDSSGGPEEKQSTLATETETDVQGPFVEATDAETQAAETADASVEATPGGATQAAVEAAEKHADARAEARSAAVRASEPSSPVRTKSAPPVPPRRPAADRDELVPTRPSFRLNDAQDTLSWEESLWGEVMRLKEIMWKARVGLDLATLDAV